VHNGGRVMSGSTHAESGSGGSHSADQGCARGNSNRAGAGVSDQGGEEQKGVHVEWLFL